MHDKFNSIVWQCKKGEMTMARGKKAANGKSQVEMVLELLQSGKEVSPVTINAVTGTKYASNFISKLRKEGYEIKSVKEGRSVVGYVLLNAPALADDDDQVEDEADEEMSADTSSAAEYDEDEELPLAASSVDSDWDDFDEDTKVLVS